MFKRILLVLAAVLLVAGCGDQSVTKEQGQVEQAQKVFVDTQPSPQFDWSLERYLFSELYKARNKAVATYSYVRSPFTGKVLSWCPSIGFPIPANTQLTNPMKYMRYPDVTIPQPEPNGLYSSPSTNGTYVMCTNKQGKVVPRYYEPNVEAYVVLMKEIQVAPNTWTLVEDENSNPSIVIDPKKK